MTSAVQTRLQWHQCKLPHAYPHARTGACTHTDTHAHCTSFSTTSTYTDGYTHAYRHARTLYLVSPPPPRTLMDTSSRCTSPPVVTSLSSRAPNLDGSTNQTLKTVRQSSHYATTNTKAMSVLNVILTVSRWQTSISLRFPTLYPTFL